MAVKLYKFAADTTLEGLIAYSSGLVCRQQLGSFQNKGRSSGH